MTCYISQGSVETPIRRGGHFMLQFCCKLTSVSVCQKLSKYMWLHKVIAKAIAKIKGCNFLTHGAVLLSFKWFHININLFIVLVVWFVVFC